MNDTYSNEEDSDHYKHLLTQCVDPKDTWDLDCYHKGTRWSVVYPLCGYTMAIFIAQGVFFTVGVWFFPTRLIGIFLQPALCCLNLGVVITAAVFRFNSMGKLASISLAPSHFEVIDGKPTLTDKRIYSDDG